MEPTKKEVELTPKEKELLTQVEQMQTQLNEEAGLRKNLLEDQAIVDVLKARKDGREIVVADKEPKETLKEQLTGNEKPSGNQVDQMSNSELLDVLIPAVEKLVSETGDELIKSAGQDLGTRMTQMESNQGKLHQALINQAAAAGVTSMRGNYADFDKFSEVALETMKKTGLSLEDAYLLEKARAGSTVPAREAVETERPQSIPSGRQRLTRQPQEGGETLRPRSAVRNFRDIVNKGVDNVLSTREH